MHSHVLVCFLCLFHQVCMLEFWRGGIVQSTPGWYSFYGSAAHACTPFLAVKVRLQLLCCCSSDAWHVSRAVQQ